MILKCWRCAGKNPENIVEFHCSASGFSQVWVMLLHRPSCRLSPRGRPEFNSSFVNFGGTVPSNEKLLYSFVFWRGKNPSLSRFLPNDFCFCKHSMCLIVILRTRATRLGNLREKCEGDKGIFKIMPDFTKHELSSAFCKVLSTLNHCEQNKTCLWGWAGHRALIYSCQKVIEIKTLSLCVQYFFLLDILSKITALLSSA